MQAQLQDTGTPAKGHQAGAGEKGRAAFTLRLDPERHLRLRLACAYSRTSAQAVVTAALDAYLDEHFGKLEPRPRSS